MAATYMPIHIADIWLSVYTYTIYIELLHANTNTPRTPLLKRKPDQLQLPTPEKGDRGGGNFRLAFLGSANSTKKIPAKNIAAWHNIEESTAATYLRDVLLGANAGVCTPLKVAKVVHSLAKSGKLIEAIDALFEHPSFTLIGSASTPAHYSDSALLEGPYTDTTQTGSIAGSEVQRFRKKGKTTTDITLSMIDGKRRLIVVNAKPRDHGPGDKGTLEVWYPSRNKNRNKKGRAFPVETTPPGRRWGFGGKGPLKKAKHWKGS
jgi:hypothetical protein